MRIGEEYNEWIINKAHWNRTVYSKEERGSTEYIIIQKNEERGLKSTVEQTVYKWNFWYSQEWKQS